MTVSGHELRLPLRLVVWAALSCLIATRAEALPFLPRCDAASQVRSLSCLLQQDRVSTVTSLAALRAIADGQATVGSVLEPSGLAANPFVADRIARGLSDDAPGARLEHPRFVRSSGSRVTAIVDGADPVGLGAEHPPRRLDEVPVATLDPVSCFLFATGLFGAGLSVAMYRRQTAAGPYNSPVSKDCFKEVTRRACMCVTFERQPSHLTPLRI